MAYEWKELQVLLGWLSRAGAGEPWGPTLLFRTLFYDPSALSLVKWWFWAGLNSCRTIEIAISEITLGNFLNLTFLPFSLWHTRGNILNVFSRWQLLASLKTPASTDYISHPVWNLNFWLPIMSLNVWCNLVL